MARLRGTWAALPAGMRLGLQRAATHAMVAAVPLALWLVERAEGIECPVPPGLLPGL